MLPILFVLLIAFAIVPLIYFYLRHEQTKFVPQDMYDEEWGRVFNQLPARRIEGQEATLYIMLMTTLAGSFAVRTLAIGWGYLFLGILFVFMPLLLHLFVHLAVIFRAKGAKSTLMIMVTVSHILLFLCLLMQFDGFDGAGYSGLTIVLSWLDIQISHSSAIKADHLSYNFALLLFISWIMVHLPWFYTSNKPKLS